MKLLFLLALQTLLLFNYQVKANMIEYYMCFTMSCYSGGSNCVNAYYHEIRFLDDSIIEYSIIQVSEVTFNFSYSSIDTLSIFGRYSVLKNRLIVNVDDKKISSSLGLKNDSGLNFKISGIYKIKLDYLKMKSNQVSIFANRVIFISKTSQRKDKCFKIRLKDDYNIDVNICLNTCWFWEQIIKSG